MKSVIYQLVFLILLTASVWAARTGGDAGAFADMGAGGRAIALEGAFVSVADDAWTIFYNPGGADQVPGTQVQFMYYRPFSEVDGINYAGLAVTKSFSGAGFALGTVGLGVQYFKASGIEETGDAGLTGNTFSDYEMALRFGWSKGFGGSLAMGRPPTYYFGLSAKVISTKVYEYSDGGFGLDVGFLLKPFNSAKIGFALENIVSPQITLIEHGDNYPVRCRAGFAYDVGGYGFATVETRVDDDGDYEVAVGGEARPVKMFALRGGYEAVYKTWAAGLGVNVSPILADFAYRPHGELGDSYIVTVGLNF
ncbi:MAG: hypothetical protein JSW52_07395 [Candidatus Coatesbacteria bacterium]|nr:MAG: hypothetical protein JSW52_07395 [Candidatus Coatesbacteria bacterium]